MGEVAAISAEDSLIEERPVRICERSSSRHFAECGAVDVLERYSTALATLSELATSRVLGDFCERL